MTEQSRFTFTYKSQEEYIIDRHYPQVDLTSTISGDCAAPDILRAAYEIIQAAGFSPTAMHSALRALSEEEDIYSTEED